MKTDCQHSSLGIGRNGRASGGYRGLLLNGKVLVSFGALGLFLGAVILVTQHLALRRNLESALGITGGDASDTDGPGRVYEVTRDSVDRVAADTTLLVGAALALAALFALGFVWWSVRRAIQPLREMIRAADQIATGELDPVISGAQRVNCWEIKDCRQTQCEAYMNLDQPCWYIDGTPCEGYEPRFPEKLAACRRCQVFQAHRGDEIHQLVDAFKHMIGTLRTSREEVLKSGDLQRRLIRNSYNGVIATDAKGLITIFNRAAEGILQISEEDVVGKLDWKAFFDPSLERDLDRPLSYERIRRVRGFRIKDSVIRTTSGEQISVLLSGISLFDRGLHVGRVFFFQDMREVEGLREELIRSERLAAAGQAAAGISHSIKNILDGFRGGAYVYGVGRSRNDQAKMDRGWEMVERNMEIISRLVMDLLNFAKDREPQIDAVDPKALIEDVVADLGLDDQDRIELTIEVEPENGRVEIDPHTFRQCLGNLIGNAAEAIPSDRPGRVTVRCRGEADRATFTVTDDGIGMDEETIQKVKGGMFSTKGSKGTGLGLLVTQKIVDEHGGTLTIESEEGAGSSFRIEVPRRNGSPAPEPRSGSNTRG